MNTFTCIEGIIGAGKTTLAKELVKLSHEAPTPRATPSDPWMLLEEPIHNPGLAKLLPLFYADPKKYAFALQIKMLHTRYRLQQVAAHHASPVVIDRSLPGDRCFAALHTKYGNMSEAEWEIYQDCYDSMSAIRPPCTMVFLDIDPVKALDRIAHRGREMESGIKLSYLTDLDAEYRALLDQIESGKHHWSRGINVIRLPVEDHCVQHLAEQVVLALP